MRAMPLTLGDARQEDASYLVACRVKRKKVEYDYVGGVTEEDTAELLAFIDEFRRDIVGWLTEHHPELL